MHTFQDDPRDQQIFTQNVFGTKIFQEPQNVYGKHFCTKFLMALSSFWSGTKKFHPYQIHIILSGDRIHVELR